MESQQVRDGVSSHYMINCTFAMGNSNNITSNLDVVKLLCDELEEFFEAYQMDRVWSKDNTKLTICFTAEKIQKKWLPN